MNCKIAVCDDDRSQIEYIADIVTVWAKRNRHIIDIKEFSSAEAFLFDYSENKAYDLLLLDVEMPGMSGVELAKTVRAENSAIQIVFITGYYEYFSDGFDVSALHYLIKPATPDKLYPVLDRAISNLSYRQRSVLLSTAEGDIKVPLAEILFIEADRMYINVHTVHGVFISRMPLAKAAEALDDTFYKVHRSFIVGLKYVRRITKTDITVSDGTQIPLSRGIYGDIHNALIKYL